MPLNATLQGTLYNNGRLCLLHTMVPEDLIQGVLKLYSAQQHQSGQYNSIFSQRELVWHIT